MADNEQTDDVENCMLEWITGRVDRLTDGWMDGCCVSVVFSPRLMLFLIFWAESKYKQRETRKRQNTSYTRIPEEANN